MYRCTGKSSVKLTDMPSCHQRDGASWLSSSGFSSKNFSLNRLSSTNFNAARWRSAGTSTNGGGAFGSPRWLRLKYCPPTYRPT